MNQELIRALVTVLFGAMAGGLTNSIAIWMLFHPYEAPSVGKRPLKMLQGAIPKNQARLAAAMIETVLDFARSQVEQVVLSVISENERASRFYEKMGFELYGLEKRALHIGDRYYDEEFRVRFLK